MNKAFLYLACPYSSPNKELMDLRFQIVSYIAGKLIEVDHLVFSPISHSHPINVQYPLGHTWEIWEKHDLTFLRYSHTFAIVCLDGWTKSVGVNAELDYAKDNGLQIKYIDPLVFIDKKIIMLHNKMYEQTLDNVNNVNNVNKLGT